MLEIALEEPPVEEIAELPLWLLIEGILAGFCADKVETRVFALALEADVLKLVLKLELALGTKPALDELDCAVDEDEGTSSGVPLEIVTKFDRLEDVAITELPAELELAVPPPLALPTALIAA
jgi:hypothetical protein